MSSDIVRIKCPNLSCQKILAVPESARGKTVRCRNCATNIRVPGLEKKEMPAAATPPAPDNP
jgi:hypothetical protein